MAFYIILSSLICNKSSVWVLWSPMSVCVGIVVGMESVLQALMEVFQDRCVLSRAGSENLVACSLARQHCSTVNVVISLDQISLVHVELIDCTGLLGSSSHKADLFLSAYVLFPSLCYHTCTAFQVAVIIFLLTVVGGHGT